MNSVKGQTKRERSYTSKHDLLFWRLTFHPLDFYYFGRDSLYDPIISI